MIKRMVLLAAFACLLPCTAMAGSSGVSFSTSGSFSNPSNPGLFQDLSFTGVNDLNINASPPKGTNLPFGTFKLKGCAPKKCFGSETFTLTITETSPGSGTGPLIATLSGILTKSKSNLSITFTKATITIGSIIYSLPVFSETINMHSKLTLSGNVRNVVPEPSARLLLSLATIGLMGLRLVSRAFV